MESFEDLNAWKIGMDLVEEVYTLVRKLPKNEQYELSQQLRRAATSIVANLAEGFSRYTCPDKTHKFIIARGECSEVKALLLIALRLQFFDKDDVQQALLLCEKTGKLLSGLINYFNKLSDNPILSPMNIINNQQQITNNQ